ncbi:MAG: T9SS type A sorting domain-containing protein [Elusimicrobiota bacterium]
MLNKKIILIIGLIFLAGIAVAVISNHNYLVLLGEIVGITSKTAGGDYTLQQSIKSDLGATKMSGGDYEMTGDLSVAMESKLENDLTKAHCYPNPYKPSKGHTKITFSRLTTHTKLKVFNIAGEFVYDKEEDTPDGELPYDVVNKDGDKLASGVYIYLITDNSGNKAKGKFAVIK